MLNYLDEHHLDQQTVRNLDSTYYTPRGICFMLTNGAGKLAYSERLIPAPSKNDRFYNPYGVNIEDCIFYAPGDVTHKENRLVLVEGLADAVAIYEAGYDGVCILGTSLTPQRIATLQRFIVSNEYRDVVYIPNNDKPGIIVVPKLQQAVAPLRIRWLPYGRKDVCTLAKYERKEFLDSVW